MEIQTITSDRTIHWQKLNNCMWINIGGVNDPEVNRKSYRPYVQTATLITMTIGGILYSLNPVAPTKSGHMPRPGNIEYMGTSMFPPTVA